MRFPGPADFVGSYDPRLSNAQDGGQATYNGSITVISLDRGVVENALPGNFWLAERKDRGSTHPVIVLVGHQRDLKILHNGVPEPAGPGDYQEVSLLIPFVVRGSGTKWHSFVVGMYLDNVGAVEIGNTVFAYSKLLALLRESGRPEDLTTRVSLLRKAFECNVQLTDSWRTADNARTSLDRWCAIQQIFEMPLVGVMEQTVCSYWEWDYTAVEVAPTTAQHQFFQPLRQGMSGWVGLGQLSGALDGTFAIRGLRWRLAQRPPACKFRGYLTVDEA